MGRAHQRWLVAAVLGVAAPAVACSFLADFGALTAENGVDAGANLEAGCSSFVPAEGLYLYESLDGSDFLGVSLIDATIQGQFDTPIKAAVTVDPTNAGCWSIVITLASQGLFPHSHTYQFCNDGGLYMVGETDVLLPTPDAATTTTYGCANEVYVGACLDGGAGGTPGECTGNVVANVSAVCPNLTLPPLPIFIEDQAYVFQGVEPLSIEDAAVPTLHYSQARTVTIEGQKGASETSDWWFLLAGGLPAQHVGTTVVDQNLSADSGCSFGIVYTSAQNWKLASLRVFPPEPDQ